MKTSAREELAKAEKLLESIKALPVSIEAAKAAEAVTLAKRRAAADRIAALEAEQTAARSKLTVDLTWAENGLAVARARLVEAEEEARAARFALLAEAQDTDAAVEHQRSILYETAWPEIDEAVEFFKAKLAELRGPRVLSTIRRGSVKNLFSLKKYVTVETNEKSVLGAMRYCQGAIAEIEAMRLRPELDTAKIEQLKHAIPTIEYVEAEPVEVSTGRP